MSKEKIFCWRWALQHSSITVWRWVPSPPLCCTLTKYYLLLVLMYFHLPMLARQFSSHRKYDCFVTRVFVGLRNHGLISKWNNWIRSFERCIYSTNLYGISTCNLHWISIRNIKKIVFKPKKYFQWHGKIKTVPTLNATCVSNLVENPSSGLPHVRK